MKVFKNLCLEIPDTNTHHFNLDELSDETVDIQLYYGYVWIDTTSPSIEENIKKIYLNVTMPTEFCGNVKTIREENFDYVYGICPYTVDWLNKITNSRKYRHIFYPYNEKDIITVENKKYDVIYHGGLHGDKYLKTLDILKKFNYRYLTMTHGINGITSSNLNSATNLNVSNKEKLRLIAETKISICFNNFPVRNGSDASNIKKRERWNENKAFKHIDDLGIIPQFKSRFNEAAISKTLNLVEKDPWNVVENFYVPDKEFIYFDGIDDLENKINEILNNWDEYQSVIDNAFQKSLKYSTIELYNKIKNGVK